MMNRMFAMGAAAVMLLAGSASAGNVWKVVNHPDGSAINGNGVDAAGYVLRLDYDGKVNTFNANTTDDLLLIIDVDNNRAVMTGTVTHNQSGDDATLADANDDVYSLEAVFKLPLLSGDWFGMNDDETLYDQLLDDLLANNETPSGSSYGTDKDRLNFYMTDLTIERISNPTNGDLEFTGPADWDEYPNAEPGEGKPLFIQVGWRDFDGLSGAGWVEPAPDLGRVATDDFLFGLEKCRECETPEIPTPAALPAGLLALGAIAARRRRVA